VRMTARCITQITPRQRTCSTHILPHVASSKVNRPAAHEQQGESRGKAGEKQGESRGKAGGKQGESRGKAGGKQGESRGKAGGKQGESRGKAGGKQGESRGKAGGKQGESRGCRGGARLSGQLHLQTPMVRLRNDPTGSLGSSITNTPRYLCSEALH
jgi:hypothetical protein